MTIYPSLFQFKRRLIADWLAVNIFDNLDRYRIPEDIALIGFRDLPDVQHNAPPLSTVRLPLAKQVYTAIDLLLKILEKETPYEPGFLEIETELVIRESTAGTRQA